MRFLFVTRKEYNKEVKLWVDKYIAANAELRSLRKVCAESEAATRVHRDRYRDRCAEVRVLRSQLRQLNREVFNLQARIQNLVEKKP